MSNTTSPAAGVPWSNFVGILFFHTGNCIDAVGMAPLFDTAKPLGITIHDHIIIGKNGHASLKGLRLRLAAPGVGLANAVAVQALFGTPTQEVGPSQVVASATGLERGVEQAVRPAKMGLSE